AERRWIEREHVIGDREVDEILAADDLPTGRGQRRSPSERIGVEAKGGRLRGRGAGEESKPNTGERCATHGSGPSSGRPTPMQLGRAPRKPFARRELAEEWARLAGLVAVEQVVDCELAVTRQGRLGAKDLLVAADDAVARPLQ